MAKTRVQFLNCDGPANNGMLLQTKPCTTWGTIAQVKWNDGNTAWVRYGDLTLRENRGEDRKDRSVIWTMIGDMISGLAFWLLVLN
jgi:hypothetical protein